MTLVSIVYAATERINIPISKQLIHNGRGVSLLLTRRMTMDLGTRNYLENVLQTPVKSTSAEDNWKKLRTGMFVVRAMAREAAAAEDFLSAYETRQRAKSVRTSTRKK